MTLLWDHNVGNPQVILVEDQQVLLFFQDIQDVVNVIMILMGGNLNIVKYLVFMIISD